MSLEFLIETSNGTARTGRLHTPHGEIETPVFMPVGTVASVKGVPQDVLEDLGVQILLGNTYTRGGARQEVVRRAQASRALDQHCSCGDSRPRLSCGAKLRGPTSELTLARTAGGGCPHIFGEDSIAFRHCPRWHGPCAPK